MMRNKRPVHVLDAKEQPVVPRTEFCRGSEMPLVYAAVCLRAPPALLGDSHSLTFPGGKQWPTDEHGRTRILGCEGELLFPHHARPAANVITRAP